MLSDTMRTIEMVNAIRVDNISFLRMFFECVDLSHYKSKKFVYILEGKGFINIQKREPKDSHTKDELGLRVECGKGDIT